MQSISGEHPLRRLFAGLVEQTFCTQVGLCNPILLDYLASLLVNFVHADRFELIGHARGKRLEQVAAMLTVLCGQQAASRVERDRTAYRHIGDYTLFWAGVYPEQLKRHTRGGTDTLLSYVSRGKESYAIVSDLSDETDALPASLFRYLSEDFEHCLFGLGLVRRELEQPDRPAGDLLL